MQLTNNEIQVLLEIIDSVSVTFKEGREIIQPVYQKLQMILLQQTQQQNVPPAKDKKD